MATARRVVSVGLAELSTVGRPANVARVSGADAVY